MMKDIGAALRKLAICGKTTPKTAFSNFLRGRMGAISRTCMYGASAMTLSGNVVKGMIVLDQPAALPDGTHVEVLVGERPDAELVRRFHDLARQWKEATIFTSSGTEMALHPAYQQIIGMGKDAIPLILEELQREEDHWFWALQSITGDDPVPPSDRGQLPKMTGAWLRWARTNGYLSCR
jgi:hypothetical protein